MPDGGQAAPGGGLIGPNAVWQLLPLIERVGGAPLRDAMLEGAGIGEVPRGAGLVAEAPVARLHRGLREGLPALAPALLREAGLGTAGYILAHRIPRSAQWALRALPAAAAGPLLARAIERHAWTFAGSGRFRVVSTRPMVFAIERNPLIRGERSAAPLCHWNAAVFGRLFRALVAPCAEVGETACAACGDPDCRFEIRY